MNSTKDITNKPNIMKIDDISNIVCKFHKLEFSELINRTRQGRIMQARQQAMYFSMQYTKLSQTDVGFFYGGRNHATVSHSCKTVNNLKDVERGYNREIEQMSRIIEDLNQLIPRPDHLINRQKKSALYRSNMKRTYKT